MANDDTNNMRGFAKMKQQGRDDEVKRIASKGGQASPTKFKANDPRTEQAARKGGEARADDEDVQSGELGRKGAQARWGSQDDS